MTATMRERLIAAGKRAHEEESSRWLWSVVEKKPVAIRYVGAGSVEEYGEDRFVKPGSVEDRVIPLSHPDTMYDDVVDRAVMSEVVDAILAELRERDKPMILAGLDSFKRAMAEEPRPGILADALTAMIDAVREGK
jgi:hypothetical protein